MLTDRVGWFVGSACWNVLTAAPLKERRVTKREKKRCQKPCRCVMADYCAYLCFRNLDSSEHQEVFSIVQEMSGLIMRKAFDT